MRASENRVDVDIRRHVANRLADRTDVIVADTVAAFPLTSESRRLDANYCFRMGHVVARLMGEAIREGRLDSRGPAISELSALINDREMSPDQLFTFVHTVMNTAIEELSLDQNVGLNTEPWPRASQIVRRAAFDLLGSWTTRLVSSPPDSAIEDPRTTLHTRPVLDAVLAKECCRAERFEHWLSMMLIDIDHLSAINQVHGSGVGDRILERMGILVRSYFRQHDWVTRYREDSIAVLLPETTPADALALAERARAMVEERLTFRDYRTDQRAAVTVSVGLASARALEGEPIDHETFSAAAEAALEQAKALGRNRVERIELQPRLISLDEASVLLRTDLQGIEQLVAEGRLDPVTAGRHVRLERDAVKAIAPDSN